MEMPNTPLEPVDEDWSSALAIVAHPDDLEFGAASAIARWTAQGKRIGYLMATRGEAGIDGIDPRGDRPIREQKKGSRPHRRRGHGRLPRLSRRRLEYGLPLRHDFAAAVRRHQPEVVITGNFQDTFGPGAQSGGSHRGRPRGPGRCAGRGQPVGVS